MAEMHEMSCTRSKENVLHSSSSLLFVPESAEQWPEVWQAKPFSDWPTDIVAWKDESVILPCGLFPRLPCSTQRASDDVAWFRVDSLQKQSSKKLGRQDVLAANLSAKVIGQGNLWLWNVSAKRSGRYVCKASANCSQVVTESVSLTVLGKSPCLQHVSSMLYLL